MTQVRVPPEGLPAALGEQLDACRARALDRAQGS